MSNGKSLDLFLNQMRNFSGSLASGTLTFYAAGTTVPKAIYFDRALTQQAANPYTLSADGTAELFASGLYRIVVKNSAGVIVYDYDDLEFVSNDSSSVADGSTFVAVTALTNDAVYTLTTGYNQFVAKDGNSSYTVTISCPVGYSFNDNTTEYVLYSDGETVEFILSGAVFYTVS